MNQNNSWQDEEKIEAEELEVKSPFVRWLDNFWYYHKWKVIIGGFFLAMFILLIVQTIGRVEPDAMFLCAGSYPMSKGECDALADAVSEYLPEDLNKDGKKRSDMRAYTIYSQEELKILREDLSPEDRAELEAAGYPAEVIEELRRSGYATVSNNYVAQQLNEYSAYLTTGDSSLYLLSPYLYQMLVEGERLRPLSEVLGEEYPDDTYGVAFSQTALYRDHEELQDIPGYFYLCLAKSYVWGASGHENVYRALEKTYQAMVVGE